MYKITEPWLKKQEWDKKHSNAPIWGERMSERARACVLTFCHQPTVTNETATIAFVCCCFPFRLCDTFWLKISAHFTCFHTHTQTQTPTHMQIPQAKMCAYISSIICFFYKRSLLHDLWSMEMGLFSKFNQSFQCDRLVYCSPLYVVNGQHAILCDENERKKIGKQIVTLLTFIQRINNIGTHLPNFEGKNLRRNLMSCDQNAKKYRVTNDVDTICMEPYTKSKKRKKNYISEISKNSNYIFVCMNQFRPLTMTFQGIQAFFYQGIPFPQWLWSFLRCDISLYYFIVNQLKSDLWKMKRVLSLLVYISFSWQNISAFSYVIE